MAKTTRDRPAGMGGRRPTTAVARFTEQVVALVTPEVRARIDALCEAHGLSQAKVMRVIIGQGIEPVEKGLTDGVIDPATLA